MWFNPGIVESVTGAIPAWLVPLVFIFSYIGSVYLIGPAVVAAYLWGERERTATWLGIVIAAYALFVFLKPLTDIPRPETAPPIARDAVPALLVPLYDTAVDFDTGSFPSGHALASTVFWGLVVRDIRLSTVRRRLVVAICIVALAGFARVVLGVHFVVDIVGAYVIGLALLAVAFALRERVTRPAEAMLGLALVPVGGAFAVGELVNATILLTAIVLCAGIDRHLEPEWQPLSSIGQ